MKFLVIVWTLTAVFASCSKDSKKAVVNPPEPPPVIADDKYTNPVFEPILADPTVVRDPSTKTFYAFGTEDDWGDGKGNRLVAVVKSDNLKDWTYVRDAFSRKPSWKANGNIWAADVNYINGKYYMYYSYSIWADPNAGIGLALSDKAEGPYVDKGKLFLSSDIGTPNAIDPLYMEDGGKKYLFFGSYSNAPDNGIWGVELSADGLTIPDKDAKFRITAGDFEGAIIHKKGDYYYFFGSKNNCCDGAASIYQVRVGRSENFKGPYLDKNGNALTTWGSGSLLIERNERFAGPGHNARIIADDEGTDWFIYHAIDRGLPLVPSGANRRALMLDKLTWENGWPVIKGGTPSTTQQDAPVFND
ncbi:MAG: arabinan endo-1,5-alpha-L-arabinosidase [Sphingobacteriaceae bacterium]|nr:MAG: arabinan endo-1,5-alpha-L-arabinosidase [Sphingobacteriaceae bacterium]